MSATGDPYRDLAKADPSKTRSERMKDLEALMRIPEGWNAAWNLYLEYTGTPPGKESPIGDAVIKTIIDHEYSNG
jgi:hypothetical protein